MYKALIKMWESFLIAGYVIPFKMLGDVDLSLLPSHNDIRIV